MHHFIGPVLLLALALAPHAWGLIVQEQQGPLYNTTTYLRLLAFFGFDEGGYFSFNTTGIAPSDVSVNASIFLCDYDDYQLLAAVTTVEELCSLPFRCLIHGTISSLSSSHQL